MNALFSFLSITGVPGLLTAVVIFIAIYLWECFAIKSGPYTHDRSGPGTFEASLARYAHLTEFIVGLAVGSIVLLAGSSIYHKNGKLPPLYGSPLVLLAMSVVLLVMFISCTTFFYEDWLYNPSKQTHRRYRLSVALGFSGLLCFVAGYVWLAFALME
jgi:magnesium-transporting ATPase (P-type)